MSVGDSKIAKELMLTDYVRRHIASDPSDSGKFMKEKTLLPRRKHSAFGDFPSEAAPRRTPKTKDMLTDEPALTTKKVDPRMSFPPP
jgi:hypothetical protein